MTITQDDATTVRQWWNLILTENGKYDNVNWVTKTASSLYKVLIHQSQRFLWSYL